MFLDRGQLDHKGLGDLLIGGPGGQQAQDFLILYSSRVGELILDPQPQRKDTKHAVLRHVKGRL